MLTLSLPKPTDAASRNMRMLRLSEHKRRKAVSPLEDRLSEDRLDWLGVHLSQRWDTLYGSLTDWRNRCQRYEEESSNNFEWRRRERNKDGVPKIYERQNDTLNTVGALAEFFAAQAANDLFGSSPWFGARPEGKDDPKLAEAVAKHMAYKLKSTNATEIYRDAVDVATILGTAFVKKWWCIETDEWEEEKHVLVDGKKQPILTASGDFVYDSDELQEVTDEQTGKVIAFTIARDPNLRITGNLDYSPRYFPKTDVAYRNLKAGVLNYRDVAFDNSATELRLEQTGFYHRFEIRIADARDRFGLTKLQVQNLVAHATRKRTNEPSEIIRTSQQDGEESGLADFVTLVEAYEKCNVLGNGKLKNIYAVFNPITHEVLMADYLANVTPKGRLPIHCHRIFRKPWQLTGVGFFEKFAYAQDDIDSQYNRVNYRIRKTANPIAGVDDSQLDAPEDEDSDVSFDPDKVVKLKPNGRMDAYLQVAKLPTSDGSEENQMQTSLQMLQLRTGITSASQGDIAGVPESNTATGIKALISRSAVLLKKQVDVLKTSLTEDLCYNAQLIYANQDTDETFLWGDGEAQELIALKADAVKGLDINVRLLMSQSQNQFKLEAAQTAIGMLTSFIQLPEVEKVSARPLFVQALKALEFEDADTIIREAIVGPSDVLPLLPPELQARFQQFLASPGAQPVSAGPQPPTVPSNATPS